MPEKGLEPAGTLFNSGDMSDDLPIWQSGVQGTHDKQTAIGRVFIRGDEVFYFPDLPMKRESSIWWPLSLGLMGAFLLGLGVLAAVSAILDPSEWYIQGKALLNLAVIPIIGLVGILTSTAMFWKQTLGARTAKKHLLEDDEFIGMSLDERYSLSATAARFKLKEIETLKGTRTVTLVTTRGDKFRFKTIPPDLSLVERLKGNPSQLPREQTVEPTQSTGTPTNRQSKPIVR